MFATNAAAALPPDPLATAAQWFFELLEKGSSGFCVLMIGDQSAQCETVGDVISGSSEHFSFQLDGNAQLDFLCFESKAAASLATRQLSDLCLPDRELSRDQKSSFFFLFHDQPSLAGTQLFLRDALAIHDSFVGTFLVKPVVVDAAGGFIDVEAGHQLPSGDQWVDGAHGVSTQAQSFVQQAIYPYGSKTAARQELLAAQVPAELQPENTVAFPKLDIVVLQALADWEFTQPEEQLCVNFERASLESPQWLEMLKLLVSRRPEIRNNLIVELTERGSSGASSTLQRAHSVLHSLGLKIWIDDFGRGVTNLNELTASQVSGVKFDQAFFRLCRHNQILFGVLATLVETAKSWGLETVAEGIETADDLVVAEALGFDFFQGYFLSRPAPVSAAS